MSKWNMIVDVERCENCHNCTLALKDEHVDNRFEGYAAPQPLHGHEWISIERKVRGRGHMVDTAYLPKMCNHCDDAPCIKAAGDRSVYKRNDGVVIIDPVKAKGRKELVEACPYGAIWWNEEEQVPQIWIFDAHLLDQGWKQPRCAQACPTGALKAVNVSDDEMNALAAGEALEVLKPELGTRPRVYYKNLHRYSKCFIGGSVTHQRDSAKECCEGAEVVLVQNGEEVAREMTDDFGDFKFDKLAPDSGEYEVRITAVGGESASVRAVLGESLFLGEIELASGSQGGAGQ